MSTVERCPAWTLPLIDTFTHELVGCQTPNDIIEPIEVEAPGTADDSYTPTPAPGGDK